MSMLDKLLGLGLTLGRSAFASIDEPQRPAAAATITQIGTRWMMIQDLPEVLAIDRACAETPEEDPWTAEDFRTEIRRPTSVALVAEFLQAGAWRIAGYLIYENCRRYTEITRLVVAPQYRRRGVGSTLVRRKLDLLGGPRRRQLIAEVAERDLPAQCFYRALGFRAVATLSDRESSYAGQESYWFCVQGGVDA